MGTLEAKVVFLGASGAGKTSFIHQYVNRIFIANMPSTVGATFFTCDVCIDEYKVRFQLWDTAGQERFHAMAPLYYRNASAAILMFDMTSLDSFTKMKLWVKELQNIIEQDIPICIVGNKSDMSPIRAVKTCEAVEYVSTLNGLYHETSALNSEGVEAVFVDIAQELIREELKKIPEFSKKKIQQTFKEGSVKQLPKYSEKSADQEKSFLCC